MEICSYTMECEQFTFDFIPKDKDKLHTLHDDHGLYSFFSIPKSDKYYIQISYPKEAYQADIYAIEKSHALRFILISIILLIIAIFFTFYSLRPIRHALKLNDEFIKDILHDFNTPITSMVINIQMFKKEHGENPFIKRVSLSIDTILHLQNNLKSFLHNLPSQNTEVNIVALAKERLQFIQNIYPKLQFNVQVSNALSRLTNEELLTRILDNILSNAAKYNKSNGEIKLVITGTKLGIEDTGKGIKNIQKVMQRYHKEQTRGLGLGLHIVQKLADELDIVMQIKSEEHVGTSVILDFKHLNESYT